MPPVKHFIFFRQHDQLDCGATCLRMISKFYGRNTNPRQMRILCNTNKKGANLFDIGVGAEKLGFAARTLRVTPDQLIESDLPCILYWNQNHFVILYKIKGDRYYVADPGKGLIKYNKQIFLNYWLGHRDQEEGIALFLDPGENFYKQTDDNTKELGWMFIFRYFYTYRKLLIQLLIVLSIGSAISLTTPFLTQALVDTGVETHNLHNVYLILIAQVMLFAGNIFVNILRSWILLYVSIRVNISVLTDFLSKLLKLPMRFFEDRTTGDIMQRMNDQQKIESFLTGTVLNSVFSILNLIIFTIILAYYNKVIFIVTMTATIFYFLWIKIFLRRRRELSYGQIENSTNNQNSIIDLINGIQEVKLNNCEEQKRWEWEKVQASAYRVKIKALLLNQYQQTGSAFITQARNILVTFLSVKGVIDGNITLGGMMAIQYIAGQVSNPVEQLLGVVQSYQDAKISVERLNDIHMLEDEEKDKESCIHKIPWNKNIQLKNITFSYANAEGRPALENISINFPHGKITAIVGMSGSGKTTLLKLLLRFYDSYQGKIEIGQHLLNTIDLKAWRAKCGTVLQGAYIFSDTIANNIALGEKEPNEEKLMHAINMANATDFIEQFPLGIHTKISANGLGLSQGQKQRILIARAVYKDPDFIFFDEATNALDTCNERIIMNNLQHFFTGKTVIIVAHRMSTVVNADNIIVLSKGNVTEQGTHTELLSQKGIYYQLVRDQLELAT